MPTVARYRVEIAGLVGGPGLSTYHFDTGAGGYTAQDAADAVELFWDTWDSIVSTAMTFSGQDHVDLLDAGSGDIIGQTGVTTWSVPGLNSNEQLSPALQGLVQWRTGVFAGSRQIVGKTFIPGPTIDQSVNPGVPTPGYVSGGTTIAQTLADSNTGFCIYSRKNGIIPPVDTGVVWPQWAVLRGRRDG